MDRDSQDDENNENSSIDDMLESVDSTRSMPRVDSMRSMPSHKNNFSNFSDFTFKKDRSSNNKKRKKKRLISKSFGEVVDTNPLPYVYTCPIPDAIVRKNDTIICVTCHSFRSNETHSNHSNNSKYNDHGDDEMSANERRKRKMKSFLNGNVPGTPLGSPVSSRRRNSVGPIQRNVSFEKF